jgi:hypothetical protein
MLRTRAAWIVGAILLLSGYVFGLATYHFGWPPVSTVRRLIAPPQYSYFADLSGKHAAPCPASGARTAVILALGQSNAANAGAPGDMHVRDAPAIVNYFDGACYAAEDPLLGSDGTVIAPFTIIGTSIGEWTSRDYFQRRLDRVVADLAKSRLPPTIVVWFQGEADNQEHTTADAYTKAFETLYRGIRARGVSASVYVSVTTLCQDLPDPALRAAQQKLTSIDGVRPGPDTDALGYGSRWDGCHFTSEGRAAAAHLWADALLRR